MAESISNKQIYSVLTDVSVAVARIEGRVGQIEDSNAELMKVVIKGNGKLPLTERVQAIENRHCTEDTENEKTKKEVKEKKDRWGTRTWGIIAAVLTYLLIQSIAFINLFDRLSTVVKP